MVDNKHVTNANWDIQVEPEKMCINTNKTYKSIKFIEIAYFS